MLVALVSDTSSSSSTPQHDGGSCCFGLKVQNVARGFLMFNQVVAMRPSTPAVAVCSSAEVLERRGISDFLGYSHAVFLTSCRLVSREGRATPNSSSKAF